MKFQKLPICGQSSWVEDVDLVTGLVTIKDVLILLDPRRDGRVRLVIHELLHVWMAENLHLSDRMVYEMEEVAICAWEKLLYDRLHAEKHAKELENWDRAIQRKLVV